MKCKICGGPVCWSGVVLHPHCLEQLRPVWHPGDEKPPTHVKVYETDEGKEPFNVSDELLCELADGSRVLTSYHAADDEIAWITADGCVVEIKRWMEIPE